MVREAVDTITSLASWVDATGTGPGTRLGGAFVLVLVEHFPFFNARLAPATSRTDPDSEPESRSTPCSDWLGPQGAWAAAAATSNTGCSAGPDPGPHHGDASRPY